MSARFPHSRRALALFARLPDRAGNCDAACPVPCLASEDAEPGHFQSDRAFATPAWLDATVAANRRTDRILSLIMLGIAGTGALWVVLPAICMWLAGGTPA